jgi:membrane-associated phospholipid phosphatase
MPSLHAGISFLVALYAIQRLRSRWRWALVAYPLTMSFALVYDGEHYVIDILAGVALALAVLAACSFWERSRGT